MVVAENSRTKGKGGATGKAGKGAAVLATGAAAFLAWPFFPVQTWAAGAVCVDATSGTSTGLVQSATTIGTVACGQEATAKGINAVAIGNASSVGNDAVGSDYSMAIGDGANITKSSTYAIAEGYSASVSAGGGVAIGKQAAVSKTAITTGAPKPQTLIDNNISYTVRGLDSTYNAERAIAIGQEAKAYIRSSIALGYGAITDTNIYSNQYASIKPVNSIAIGTGAYASGNRSISIGENAGKGSLGWENVAIGVGSGQNIKPMTVDMNGGTMLPFGPTWTPAASGNVALGNNTGNNITGGGNLAVGTNAGNNVGPITDPDPKYTLFPPFYGYGGAGNGSNNTAIGPAAGGSVQGSQNIGIGFRAGQQVKGNNNMAMGQLAGYIVDGSGNAAIGSYTGSSVIGFKNAALGNGAGSNVTGSSNTAVGDESGDFVTGDYNVTNGYGAGRYPESVKS